MASQQQTNRFMEASLEDGDPRDPFGDLFSKDLPIPTLDEALEPFPKLGPSVRVARQKASRIAHKFPSLTHDEIASIVLYTIENHPPQESVCYMVNGSLRSRERKHVHPWRLYIWLLVHSLRKLPPAEEKFAYRGLKVSPASVGIELISGFPFIWCGFSSTATRLEVMNDFVGNTGTRTLITIELTEPVGWNIQEFSLYPGEHEILLPPNSSFEVISHFDAGGELTLIQARQTETCDPIIDMTMTVAASSDMTAASSATAANTGEGSTAAGNTGASSAVAANTGALPAADADEFASDDVASKELASDDEWALYIKERGEKAPKWARKLYDARVALDLSNDKKVREDALAFGLAVANSKVDWLDLSSCDLTTEAVRTLASSRCFAYIKCLSLHCNAVSDDGIKALLASSVYSLRLMKRLDLDKNHICDEGVAALVTSGKLLNLAELYLAGNHISDKGVVALATESSLYWLEILDLSKNRIGDTGAEALKAKRSLRRIEELDLHGNLLSDEVKSKLRRRFSHIDRLEL